MKSKVQIISNVLLVLFAAIFIASCASYASMSQAERNVEFVDEQPYSKDEAFGIVNEWLAKTFVSANDVVQLRDKESGTLVIQAIGSYYYDMLNTLTQDYRFSLTVKLKDNKMKMEFVTNTIVTSDSLPQKKDVEKINKDYEDLRAGLLKFMANYSGDDF